MAGFSWCRAYAGPLPPSPRRRRAARPRAQAVVTTHAAPDIRAAPMPYVPVPVSFFFNNYFCSFLLLFCELKFIFRIYVPLSFPFYPISSVSLCECAAAEVYFPMS
uniref:Uncharacterized protein n=1 Tax=Arundo donax TaxID=35708 RepID=A0A0A9GC56_ARUDO